MTASSPDARNFDAADWAARLDGAPLTPAEKSALRTWLAADSAHEAELAAIRDLYTRLSASVPRLADAGQLAAPGARAPLAFGRWATGLAASAALALAGLWYVRLPEDIATHTAQRQTVTLDDGTRLDLNADTALSVRLRSSERDVTLAQGEAYFAVAKDPSRPFVIVTPAGTVRVTGTAFNVRSFGPGQLEVTVAEGSVNVTLPGSGLQVAGRRSQVSGFMLTPHDQLTFDGAKAAVRVLTPEATADALAWREGRAVFDSEPLGSAVQRFARYHGREIEVSPDVARLELGGRFRLDELDDFLRDIQKTLPVQVLRSGDRIRILPRP